MFLQRNLIPKNAYYENEHSHRTSDFYIEKTIEDTITALENNILLRPRLEHLSGTYSISYQI